MRYGFSPFGQFTRHLSNSTEELVLADAFGNLIDFVEYSDQSPWPYADGNGAYLRLKDPALDNTLAENWEASSDVITSIDEPASGISITIYPNPVRDFLTVRADIEISSLSLYDIRGNILLTTDGTGEEITIDMGNLIPGTYIVRVFTRKGSFPHLVVKE
ncbi:MAG: T9SS type A sorting domain-containing protein [Bacteroidales bacterium]